MNLTDTAIKKITTLIKDSQIAIPDHDLFLRIGVSPGGCSGLRYQTYFDYEEKEGDYIISYEHFDVYIDKMSVPYLLDSTLDFVDTIEKQGFTIDNPSAVGSCACGDSFH
jgi:iron-sulfur cluster assembly accessory protein